jgi:hypothetical protein
MRSKVHMEIDAEGKIVKVQDKWNGKLPDNTILNVFLPLLELITVLPESKCSDYAEPSRRSQNCSRGKEIGSGIVVSIDNVMHSLSQASHHQVPTPFSFDRFNIAS